METPGRIGQCATISNLSVAGLLIIGGRRLKNVQANDSTNLDGLSASNGGVLVIVNSAVTNKRGAQNGNIAVEENSQVRIGGDTTIRGGQLTAIQHPTLFQVRLDLNEVEHQFLPCGAA